MAKRNKRNLSQDGLGEKIVRTAAAEAKKRVPNVCPIFRPKTALEPELIGSGVFLAAGKRRFLLTAAHVFGPSGEGHQELHIPSDTSGNLTELIGTYVRSINDSGSSENDFVDVGIVLLSDSLAAQISDEHFIGIDSLDVYHMGDHSKVYIAMGYPWRTSPRADFKTRRVSASLRSYAADLLGNEELDKLGLHRRSHFFLRYAKRHSMTELGRDITAPDPDGMSGGPLWCLKSLENPGANLVGIILRWYRLQGGILVVRLPAIIAGIIQLCPELKEILPATSSLPIEITSPPLSL